MNIIDSHIHLIRFRINKNIRDSCETKWKKLKENCEYGPNSDIAEMIINHCQIQDNKNLQILEGTAGGIGTGSKEIKFRHKYKSNFDYRDYGIGYDYGCGFYNTNDNDNDIILNITSSQNGRWTYDDLDDITLAFIKVARQFTGVKYITGHIELESKKILENDSASSSDCESD